MAADGQAVPSKLDAVTNDPHDAQAVAFMVDAPMVAPRSVRVNVMLPEDVLQPINKVSGNRSRFPADAARAKLRAPEDGDTVFAAGVPFARA